MYIDFKKMGRKALFAVAVLTMVFGLFMLVFSPSSQQQSVGVQTAIFGLLLLWFLQWRTEQ